MKGLDALTPAWDDYELIDSGGFEKLERIGRFVTLRPEPQAVWRKSLPEAEWERLATAIFRREGGGDERGRWLLAKGMPEQWHVGYNYKDMHLRMRLGLTAFKHVGLFPEQASNWNFIYDSVESIITEKPRVLNLFAYTGGASLVAAAAGADVTHVDSVRQVISWGRENMETSGLDGIRWVVEDALKFVRREVKRGKTYHGIILDPPAYGRGPDGEKWVLEENIGELLELCSELLVKESKPSEHIARESGKPSAQLAKGGEPVATQLAKSEESIATQRPVNAFLVVNLYSMGLSALLARSAVDQLFPKPSHEEFGELYFSDRASKILPLGVFYRSLYRGIR